MESHNSNGDKKKKCASCKEIKPITEFYKDATRKDGLYTRCKKCHYRITTKWRKNNLEKVEADRKKRRTSYREKERRYAFQWARDHPERVRMNREKWHTANPEYGKIWRKNNKDKVRNYSATRKARLAGNGGDLTVEEWHAILDFYGHKCLCCGRDDVKLTIDHVNPIFQGGKHSADNVQPLCGPCNSRKKDKYIDYRKEKYHASSRN